MRYCLYCGKLRETANGMCRQCAEDEYLRKHPGWARRKDLEREIAKREAKESLI